MLAPEWFSVAQLKADFSKPKTYDIYENPPSFPCILILNVLAFYGQ